MWIGAEAERAQGLQRLSPVLNLENSQPFFTNEGWTSCANRWGNPLRQDGDRIML